MVTIKRGLKSNTTKLTVREADNWLYSREGAMRIQRSRTGSSGGWSRSCTLKGEPRQLHLKTQPVEGTRRKLATGNRNGCRNWKAARHFLRVPRSPCCQPTFEAQALGLPMPFLCSNRSFGWA